LGDLTNVR